MTPQLTLATAENICALCKFSRKSGTQVYCEFLCRTMNGGDYCNAFRRALKHKDGQP